MDYEIKVGFKLECVGTYTFRAKTFFSIEVNKIGLEMKMKEVTRKIISL